MGMTVGQMYLNLLLPILLVNVMYLDEGDTSSLPEETVEELNAWTSTDWVAAWVTGSLIPVEQCNGIVPQQLYDYACQNDYYYDAEGSDAGGGEERRKRHIGRRRQNSFFLSHREASNFLLRRSKKVRGGRTRRSTTISAECCGQYYCTWEEVGEYCVHARLWHLP